MEWVQLPWSGYSCRGVGAAVVEWVQTAVEWAQLPWSGCNQSGHSHGNFVVCYDMITLFGHCDCDNVIVDVTFIVSSHATFYAMLNKYYTADAHTL